MATPIWKPGTLYNPGAIVQRASAPPVVSPAASVISNNSFETGSTDWTLGAGWETTSAAVFQGAAAIRLDSTTGGSVAGDGGTRTVSLDLKAAVPGQSITAQVGVRTGAGSRFELLLRGGRCELDWLDENEVFISRSQGNVITGNGNSFRISAVTGIAPPGTAFVRASLWAFRSGGNERVYFDLFTWNYARSEGDPNLVFRAVQANAGFSGAIEPIWPLVNGQQVIDNDVTWEAITSSRVVWEANPILVSDYDEPEWPLQVDGAVVDNTIIWTAISRRVIDEKCPNTAIVTLGASKVFSGDNDIIPFSATVNPLDWTTAEDAGYLPFGLQTFGANPVTALGLYRTNLIAFNSEGFQMWQIDEDPTNMAILDAAAVGCIWPKTLFPVQNDLVFLSNVGVRNISIAGASTNLQAGMFGEAIDPLVLAAIRAGTYEPLGLFVPAYGQYWLFFGAEAFVLTISDVKKMSWSRYEFPEVITDWTLEGGVLLLRTETHKVWRFSPEAVLDDQRTAEFDLPYLPPGLDTGALIIDANAVLDRRISSGGTFSPNSYGGNPATFNPPAYALVLQDMNVGVGNLECVINGLDENGDAVSETITFDGTTAYRYIVGSQLFSQINSIDQTGNSADQFFSVGYQRYVEDDEVEALTVTIHGYWSVNNSSDPANNQGLFVPPVTESQPLPASSVLLVRRNVNATTTARTWADTVETSASVTLPPGAIIGEVVIGTVELDAIMSLDRTGSGGVNPFVDLGIQFVVATAGTVFDGTIWWPYLDFNTIGVEKMFGAVDLTAVAPAGVAVSIGYDQRDITARTTDHDIAADTLPIQSLPIPCAGPSFDMRLTFNGGSGRWEWFAAVLYISDMRPGA